MQSSSAQFQRLFDIKRTQLEMVEDRGFDLDPSERSILGMDTLSQFVGYTKELMDKSKTSFRGALTRMYATTKSSRRLLAYFAGKTSQQQKQVSAEVIRSFINIIQTFGITEAILIVDAPISSTGNEELSALKLTKWHVYQDGELTYNPTRHVDVPKHERLDPTEATEILKQMQVIGGRMLLMRTSDPIAKYYGFEVGSHIKITRNDVEASVLVPTSVIYRRVIE